MERMIRLDIYPGYVRLDHARHDVPTEAKAEYDTLGRRYYLGFVCPWCTAEWAKEVKQIFGV